MSEQTPQNETSKSILEAFSFIKCEDEKLNERVHAMASLLHTASMMVIKSESRKGDGFEDIRYLETAFLYYKESQFRKRFDKEEEKEEPSRIIS